MKALVTGAAGFFGGILKQHLLAGGWTVAGVDVLADAPQEGYAPYQIDIRDRAAVDRAFGEFQPDAIFHCAAVLAHDRQNRSELWSTNVDGTACLAQAALRAGVRSFVFLSSNCLWGCDFGRPITEADPPAPIEIYGRSKLAAEQELLALPDLRAKIIRCPTIVAAGRLGLLAILFEFIDEGRIVWLVGGGGNRYQFISAEDLAEACEMLAFGDATGVFHVGSENVPTIRDMFGEVIRRAGSDSRLVSIPRLPSIFALRLLSVLGLSPLGPYHYRMIASNFEFDTSRLRAATGWRPTAGNTDILWQAYQFYAENLSQLSESGSTSAHRRPSGMGALKLVKWLS